MFQTFSGSSRRLRQVNLSGQNTNPFSASSWTPTASGTQKTVAAAQQERQQRQRERERLNAAKRIQRTWRGHRTRKHVSDERRRAFDELESRAGTSAQASESLAFQSTLLINFYSLHRADDQTRLVRFAQYALQDGLHAFSTHPDTRSHVGRLAGITVTALGLGASENTELLLDFLISLIDSQPYVLLRLSPNYYKMLATLLQHGASSSTWKSTFLRAVGQPFTSVQDPAQKDFKETVYGAFGLYLLTTAEFSECVANLSSLTVEVDVDELANVLSRALPNNPLPKTQQLWMLANLISLHRLQRADTQEPSYLRAISLLLSSCAEDIISAMQPVDTSLLDDLVADEDEEKALPARLPTFIEDQLISLVNQQSISGLLARFNLDYNNPYGDQENATALANYALMLLRIFPERGDEIRMWLYLGSMTTAETGDKLPAVKFFWHAMKSTWSFSHIVNDPKAALAILRESSQQRLNSNATSITNNREWGAILLFLELYVFVLRFIDDEEFLSGGEPKIGEPVQERTRSRESALPLEDVKLLTTFLKNLAFTMYYHSGDLFREDKPSTDGVLSAYFGNSRTSVTATPTSGHNTTTEGAIKHADTSRLFAGIAGMTFSYVRDTVTGVMKMLYERDSRRRFLPKDHWLMTSQFDMEGFIPAVVIEEERQHEVAENGDEDLQDEEDFASNFSGLVGTQQSRAVQRQHVQRQQQQAARKKVMAMVGPRLEVLQNMPFVIPFETRVRIFRQFVTLDQLRRRNGHIDPEMWRMSMVQQSITSMHGHTNPREVLGRHHARIRRDNVFEDAFDQFYTLGEGLKEPIQITFVDKFDTVEAGIDGGGVTKEFLTSVTTEAFYPSDLSLFVSNDQNLLYPNPSSVDTRKEMLRLSGCKGQEFSAQIKELLQRYEFLGRVIGKCLYEGILVDIAFAGFFLLKWATAGTSGSDSTYRANINDLRDLDESLYQGLLQLKNYPGNVEDFSLDFTIADPVSLPGEPTRTITRELLPNGADMPVTNANRPLYISLVAKHRLHLQPYAQTQAFLRGLRDIIKPSWLSMFNQTELQTLISGEASEIDVEDLRRNTQYGGIYVIGDDSLEHPTIQLFWQVMHELDDEERRKVLKYVTSTPRAPLLGFSQLNPKFSIRDAGNDESRLPSTSTCVNLLKLPRYTSAETLRHKLLYAVNSGAGFDLS